jgi:hypothetical protein
MTDTKLLAAALNHISEGFAELALAIEQPEVGERVAPGSSPRGGLDNQPATIRPPVPQTEEEILDEVFGGQPQGSAARCPKHLKTFTPSKYPDKPAFCSAKDDDPVWSHNGWCSINASNVATYLKAQAAA